MKNESAGGGRKKETLFPRYKTVVFAGGGSRCLWQVGFLDAVTARLKLKPTEIVGVSAGASMACMLYSGNKESSLAYFREITAVNRKNFYPEHILSGKPVYPHYAMYRDVLLKAIDIAALKRLYAGPDISVLITRPPVWAGPRLATLTGMGAYMIERKISYPVHPRLTRKIGFKYEMVRVRECASPEDLADLLLASSCTPPFTPILKWRGRTALDGGFIDNVPADFASDQNSPMLIMLTRRYPHKAIPAISNRTYVQPSRDIPITKWDYTNPAGLDESYELGRQDGIAFLERKAK